MEYLDAVLRQDMEFFDLSKPGSISLNIIDAAMDVQVGLGDKFAQMLQGIFQFVFGFVVAFYFGWQLSLSLLVWVIPLGFTSFLLFKFGEEDGVFGKEAYEAANNVVSETLSNIKTILSLNGETTMSRRYNNHLDSAMVSSIIASTKMAAALGSLFAIIFAMEGFGFWFGFLSSGTEGLVSSCFIELELMLSLSIDSIQIGSLCLTLLSQSLVF